MLKMSIIDYAAYFNFWFHRFDLSNVVISLLGLFFAAHFYFTIFSEGVQSDYISIAKK